jgi:hypothetical protein
MPRHSGTLIELDISNNRIAAAQRKDLQHICAAGSIELLHLGV